MRKVLLNLTYRNELIAGVVGLGEHLVIQKKKKKEKSHLRCKTHEKKCSQSFLKINSLYNRGVEVRVSLFTEIWCLQQHSSS